MTVELSWRLRLLLPHSRGDLHLLATHHMFQRAIHRSRLPTTISLGVTRQSIRLPTAVTATIRQSRAMSEIIKISTPKAAQREFIEVRPA